MECKIVFLFRKKNSLSEIVIGHEGDMYFDNKDYWKNSDTSPKEWHTNYEKGVEAKKGFIQF